MVKPESAGFHFRKYNKFFNNFFLNLFSFFVFGLGWEGRQVTLKYSTIKVIMCIVAMELHLIEQVH